MESFCRSYGYSRQAYYKRLGKEQKEEVKQRMVLEAVKKIRERQPEVGAKKIQKMINNKELCVEYIGRDWLFSLLRKEKLLITIKKKYVRTTNSVHGFKIYRNEIKELEINKSNQVFASDITYIDTCEGYGYLALVTDMYSRKIVGYDYSQSLVAEGSIRALKKAIRQAGRTEGIIHHSDRGIQYCCKKYMELINKNKMQISMTEENHVYENAMAERVNGILKNEFYLGDRLISHKIAERLVKEAIEIYNKERLHSSIGFLTPEYKHVA